MRLYPALMIALLTLTVGCMPAQGILEIEEDPTEDCCPDEDDDVVVDDDDDSGDTGDDDDSACVDCGDDDDHGDSDVDNDEDGYFDDVDCNDYDDTVYPGAEETPYDGIDSNCNGLEDDYDFDGDGEVALGYGGADCNDLDEDVNPDADEIWYDGVDQNCDEWSDYDQDGDGFDSESYGGDDCNDILGTTYPAAPDVWDGDDSDCDGEADYLEMEVAADTQSGTTTIEIEDGDPSGHILEMWNTVIDESGVVTDSYYGLYVGDVDGTCLSMTAGDEDCISAGPSAGDYGMTMLATNTTLILWNAAETECVAWGAYLSLHDAAGICTVISPDAL